MREARGNSCQLELEGTVGKEECGTISITLMRLCLTYFLALGHWERQETTWYGR